MTSQINERNLLNEIFIPMGIRPTPQRRPMSVRTHRKRIGIEGPRGQAPALGPGAGAVNKEHTQIWRRVPKPASNPDQGMALGAEGER